MPDNEKPGRETADIHPVLSDLRVAEKIDIK